MTEFACVKCRRLVGDVRLVEHGTDDVALCKLCFKEIGLSSTETDRTTGGEQR